MGAAEQPGVTVVVPVRDGAELLDRCLAALDAQDYPAHLVQVLVVDNGSTEDVGAVVARHRATLLRQPVGGSYTARNAALGHATGPVLAFTDADCDPAPTWLSTAVADLQGPPEAAMVGGAVALTYAAGAPRTGSELFESLHSFPQQRYLQEEGFAATANMVTWRHVLDRVGPFADSLASGGDKEWGQRVRASGALQRYSPGAVVRHPARSGLGESVRKWRRVATGRLGTGALAGRDRAFYWRQVRRNLRAVVDEVPRAGRQLPASGPFARARYLGAHSTYRLVTAAVLARGMVSPPRP